jgi:ribonuclease-3
MDVTESTVRELGLAGVSPEALGRAFVHRSARARSTSSGPASSRADNERLEFLGDSVVQLVMTKYLYARYADVSEGVMTKRRNRLVCGQVMTDIATRLGIGRYIVVGEGRESIRASADALEDAFEAVAAVAFLELGYESAERWIVGAYESNVNIAELLSDEIEYKDRLVKHFARTGRAPPQFSVSGGGSAGFRASVTTGRSNVIGVGSGRTRRAAENDAARNAYKYLSA